jgi:hypothetical protein
VKKLKHHPMPTLSEICQGFVAEHLYADVKAIEAGVVNKRTAPKAKKASPKTGRDFEARPKKKNQDEFDYVTDEHGLLKVVRKSKAV